MCFKLYLLFIQLKRNNYNNNLFRFQVGRAVQIYKDMVSHGVSPNATTFNCLIGAATESDSVSTMHSIGSWLDSSSTDIRAQCMNTYITGLVKLKMWNEALIRFHSMLSPSSPSHPTLATFNAIMNGEIERGDYHAVLRTFDDMRASAVAPTIVAYNNLLTAQASLGAWSEALETLHVILSASRDGINANLTTCESTEIEFICTIMHVCDLGRLYKWQR